MPHSVYEERRPFTAFRVMLSAKPAGPVIGRFADQAFHELIRDEWDRVYAYAGITSCTRDGQYDCTHLGEGEFVLPPGIIYRMIDVGRANERRAADRVPRTAPLLRKE